MKRKTVMLLRYIFTISITLGVFTACGGSSNSNSTSTNPSEKIIGYLIDSPIVNMTYTCGVTVSQTGSDGKFECDSMPVVFTVGGLEIGKLDTITTDGEVYPQDLAGVSRDDTSNPEVLKIASFLQSLDDDADISKSITIPDNIRITSKKKLSDMTQSETEELLRDIGQTPVTLADAKKHLVANTPNISGSTNGDTNSTDNNTNSSTNGDINSTDNNTNGSTNGDTNSSTDENIGNNSTTIGGGSSGGGVVSSIDTIAPIITLNGSATITIFKGETYTELGATAVDNKDGTITSNIVTTGAVVSTTVGTYTITYKVSDAAGNQATKTRTVNVILGTPILANSTATVEENSVAGTKIGAITISSIGDKNITSITLSGTGNENFLVSKDGNITIKSRAVIDYEITKEYNLTAIATNSTGSSSSVKVDISVTNIIEMIPILSATTASVDENVSIGTTVVMVKTAGTYSDQNITSSFTIVSGNTGDDFNISNTGVISTQKRLDFERTESYTLKVKATNTKGDSALVDVVITIGNDIEVTISGVVTYDLVPTNSNHVGLDYSNITHAKAKGVVVEILDSDNQTLNSTVTDANGTYSFSNIEKSKDVKIRVYAKMLKTGTPSWDVKVLDNTNNNSLYVMEGSLVSSGTSNSQARNLNASSGWGGSAYTTTRVAAPFAILGTIYKSMEKVKSADANIVFPPLNVFWSVDNIVSNNFDAPNGQIMTSHYNGTELYILGKADNDSDEYDDHVIAHEWGHYYENRFSRADSIGGSHNYGDKLDIRVAFSEGFANAFSGMTLENPLYFDTMGDAQSDGWSMNLEHESHNTPGWFSESSIQRILYDIYDSVDDSTDANDALSLGFTPIHELLIDAQKNTTAFTSIFSFITKLKEANSDSADAIDDIVASEDIAEIIDIYGNDRTDTPYSTMTIGEDIQVCLSTTNGKGNKLDNHKYLKFNIATTGDVDIQTTEEGGADAVMEIYQVSPFASLGFFNRIQRELPAGDYLIDIFDYNDIDNPPCFDINSTTN